MTIGSAGGVTEQCDGRSVATDCGRFIIRRGAPFPRFGAIRRRRGLNVVLRAARPGAPEPARVAHDVASRFLQ
jgi:hypothetical protein